MWRANLTDIPTTMCRNVFSFFIGEILKVDGSNGDDEPTAVG
jgi:hypothetical protein